MKKLKSIFEGKRVIVRKLKCSDVKDIYKNINSKNVTKWMSNKSYPLDKNKILKYIKKTIKDEKENKVATFGIALKENNRIIGVIDLSHIDIKNKNAEIGYWIGEKYWGKGLIMEAIGIVLKFAFNRLRLHRIYATLCEENVRSERVLKKCLFKYEGLLRDARYKHKKWHNELIYSILKN